MNINRILTIIHFMNIIIFISFINLVFIFSAILSKILVTYLIQQFKYISILSIYQLKYQLYCYIIKIYLSIIYLNMPYPTRYHPRNIVNI